MVDAFGCEHTTMGFSLSIVAPKARKHLSADALLHVVRSGFATIPDPRGEDGDMSFTEALMAACALFSLTAPALLACDKERAEGNGHTSSGIPRVPCDTCRREILAPVSPTWLRPVCTRVLRHLQRGKALEAMGLLDGHDLLALDGTGSFSSQTMHCASCWHQGHRNGSVTYAHQMWGAALIHPDVRAVMPRRPEPLGQYDGTDNHAGARHAAKRCLSTRRQAHPHLQCLVTADSRRANAPPIETRHHPALHALLGGKAGDHGFLCQHVQEAEHAGRVTSSERPDRAAGVRHRGRLVNARPLNASHGDVRGHGIASWEMGDGKVPPCRWVTALRVSTRHVLHLMRGGRARWTMAHATFQTLQHQGDHVEPNDGHGAQQLSVVCAMGMLLAFVVDQTPQRCGAV
jgi:hypothetical protein